MGDLMIRGEYIATSADVSTVATDALTDWSVPTAIESLTYVQETDTSERSIFGTEYPRDARNRPKITIIPALGTDEGSEYPVYDRFIAMAMNEEDTEKVMVAETFGLPHVFATGRMVRRISFTGMLRTTPSDPADNMLAAPQYMSFRQFYDKFLRASEQLRQGTMTRITIDQEQYDGYVLALTNNRTADSQSFGGFSFSFICLSRRVVNQKYQRALGIEAGWYAEAIESKSSTPMSSDERREELKVSELRYSVGPADVSLDITQGEKERSMPLMVSGKQVVLKGLQNQGVVKVVVEPAEAAQYVSVLLDWKEIHTVLVSENKEYLVGLKISDVYALSGSTVQAFTLAFGNGQTITVTIGARLIPTYTVERINLWLNGNETTDYWGDAGKPTPATLTNAQVVGGAAFVLVVKYATVYGAVPDSALNAAGLASSVTAGVGIVAAFVAARAVPVDAVSTTEAGNVPTGGAFTVGTPTVRNGEIRIPLTQAAYTPSPLTAMPAGIDRMTGIYRSLSVDPRAGIASPASRDGKIVSPRVGKMCWRFDGWHGHLRATELVLYDVTGSNKPIKAMFRVMAVEEGETVPVPLRMDAAALRSLTGKLVVTGILSGGAQPITAVKAAGSNKLSPAARLTRFVNAQGVERVAVTAGYVPPVISMFDDGDGVMIDILIDMFGFPTPSRWRVTFTPDKSPYFINPVSYNPR